MLLHVLSLPPCAGTPRNTELINNAHDAITNDLLSSKWRENNPDVVHWMPFPWRKEYDPEIPEPEPLPERNWTEFELRAWVEKRRWRANKDAGWQERQQNVGRCDCSVTMFCLSKVSVVVTFQYAG